MVWIVNDATIDGSETGTSFKQALYAMECGFALYDTMIWEKDTFSLPDASRYYSCFEYMFIFSKGKPQTVNLIEDRKNKYSGTKIHGTFRNKNGETVKRDGLWAEKRCKEYGARFNIWEIPSEKNNTTGHPAVFPLRLASDHIISWSNEGDTVLDPFLGSGTTRIAAYDLNRNFIGYEISKEYFDEEEKRFEAFAAQTRLF